jgi:Flp pilus assembly protein TadD
MQKQERINWIIALLIFGFLIVAFWFFGQPILRQQNLGLVSDIISIITGLLYIVVAIAALVRSFRPPPQNAEEKQEILKTTSPEDILNDYVPADWRGIAWLNREIITDTYLRKHPCVVLVGTMKSGKSREAAELVRAALDKGTCLPKRTFDITDGVKHMTPEQVQAALSGKMDCEAPTLFYINDLPRQATALQLKALTHCVNAIRRCNRGYFVGTARRDHLALNPALQKWLKDNEIESVEMKSLSPEQVEQLAREQAIPYGIRLEPQAIDILKRKCDGTPNHILMMFKYLKGKGVALLTNELAEEMAVRSQEDIWAEVRGDLMNTEATVGSLLKAMAMFHHTNVTPYADIVQALARSIPMKNGRRPSQDALLRAVELLLSHYGTTAGVTFKFPDYAIEIETAPAQPADEMAGFLQNYRRLYHNPILRRLNKQAVHQRECLSDLAAYYYYQNNKTVSIVLLKAALKASKGTPAIWYNLGVLLVEQGRKEEAEQAYRKAVDADPKYAAAWSNLGLLLVEQGRKEEAEQVYRKALDADPKHAVAWSNLGVLLAKQDRKDEAEQAWRKAIDADPKDAPAWDYLGTLLRSANRYEEAITALNAVISLSPERAIYYAGLGAVYRKLGRQEEAEAALNKAQQYSQNEPVYNQACIAALCGQTERAFARLRQVLEDGSTSKDWVLHDPDWEDYHTHPDFLALVS